MNEFTKLAKQTVEEFIKSGTIIQTPENLPKEFQRRAGVFVTIFNGEELRGCIGTYLPTQDNLADEIISNAISACSRDYRFEEITSAELPQLNYEVSILSEPQPLLDPAKHDTKKYGIIVKSTDGRSGLLLPDLDEVDTLAQQISIAKQKAGMGQDEEDVKYYYFTVEKYT